MRLFIALQFDKSAIKQIIAIQRRLQEAVGKARFTAPENLHLTLAFLGETDADRLDAIQCAMKCTPIEPMTLIFDHIGNFPQTGGLLWWIGLKHNPALIHMQRILVENLKQEKFYLQSRKFKPHLTLARQAPFTAPLDSQRILPTPISAHAGCMSLMLSERPNGRLTYTELFSIGTIT